MGEGSEEGVGEGRGVRFGNEMESESREGRE